MNRIMAKLYFYYAAMNAGKTTTLLQSNFNYVERGMSTYLFIPDFVNSIIQSRIGLKEEAIPFNSTFDFIEFIQTNIRVDCIMVDESQFLSKNQVQQLSQIVDMYNIPVLCYGLRTDFKGEPFEGSKYLLSWADKLIELKTICSCGKKATMNKRINNSGKKVVDGKQIEIGGNEKYISTCRKCF